MSGKRRAREKQSPQSPVEGGEAPERSDEGLLGQVLRQGRVAHQPHDQVEHQPSLASDEVTVGALGPFQRFRGQLAIG